VVNSPLIVSAFVVTNLKDEILFEPVKTEFKVCS